MIIVENKLFPLQILIAGPYRSGTNDDPVLMEKNLRKLEEAALPIFRAGHLPVIGEWYALPLLKVAGSQYLGDPIYEEILYPVAARIIRKCYAILRLEGASKGADGDVRQAEELGIPVYYRLEDLLAELKILTDPEAMA
ncbi:hypothetical protein ACX0G9_25805 [Flavitalea flava]